MREYDVIITSVHSRRDLLDRTVRSMIPMLDQPPRRILVHEDAKAGESYDPKSTEEIVLRLETDLRIPITLQQRSPGRGLGRAVLHLLTSAETEFVLYTQEDFDFLRPIPVARCLDTMAEHEMHHVRFNKRRTMAVKGAHRPPHEQFHKLEVELGGETFCVSDHWYFQASLWRRSIALEGFKALAATRQASEPIDRCEAAFNHWLNTTHGNGVGAIEAERRLETVRTFIWGPIGEPAFIQHTGHDRRSQGWPNPEKRNPNS